MKIIIKIAKNELRYLFYSPIAWFLMIVFLVQCATAYSGLLYDVANRQDIMLKNSSGFVGFQRSLTKALFSNVFQSVINNLYLFIPLLTMGLISREINTGSSKLLYSSPIRVRQIVLGKYLGIILYNLILVSILVVFMLLGVWNIRHVDYGLFFSSALGFYLLICVYSAIGMFMSSLTNYQIVSALSTFVIVFALGHIGELWQKYDVIRDLTYFLSLQNRTIKMLYGLIVTRDVIYFILVSGMFVGFTLIKLKSGREDKPWYVKAGRYAMVMVLVLAIGYTGSRPTITGYLDTTANKVNTIPVPMQKLISQFADSTLEVTLYTNLLGGGLAHGLPEARNSDYLANFWEPYLRFKPDIVFKYEYYYAAGEDSMLYKAYPGKTLKQIAEENADAIDVDLSAYKTPEEMRKMVDLKPESYRLVMALKYKGRTEFLRTFEDPFFWPDLNNLSAALTRFLLPEIPKVYFVTGDQERSIFKGGERDYSGHTAAKASRGALVNAGYNVDTLNLAYQDIPADISMLALADPKIDISPIVSGKLRSYIADGGNIMITGEPGKQHILNPLLQSLGVQLMNGQLVQPSYDETPDKVTPYLTGQGLADSLASFKKLLESSRDTMKGLMPGVTGLAYTGDSGFSKIPLLKTLPGVTWLKAGDLVIDSTLPPLDTRQGDLKEDAFTTGVQLTRQANTKEQRIAIFGDADFTSNMRFGINFFNTMAIYHWMTYNKYPGSMGWPDPKDILLRISVDAAVVQKIVFVWALPGLLILLGAIILIRRKRQ